jgi:hypothetical protein
MHRMSRASLTAAATLALGFQLVACGDDGASSSGAGGDASSGPGQGQGGETSSGTLSSGSSSNACDRGLAECDGACVDLYADRANCGACGVACADGEHCSGRECFASDGCSLPEEATECEGGPLCDLQPYLSIDHCGSCGNACGDDEYCYARECRPRGGDGSSCASPFILLDDESMQFWFDQAGESHLFSCGPLDERPSVWFRWTSEDSDSETVGVKVNGNDERDDLILEVFSGAECDEGVALACNDDADGGSLPELGFTAELGQTYFIAVGYAGDSAPAGRFALHMDD